MELMNALVAARALTSEGWDTEGPADMATWIVDALDQEVVVFDSGNVAQDVANASFVAMAHQAVPHLVKQMAKMQSQLLAMADFCRNTDFGIKPGDHNGALALQLQAAIAQCEDAAGLVANTVGACEFKVTIPQADSAVRAELSHNFPTKAQAISAAQGVLAQTEHEKAVIFRITLDAEGHVTQHEVSQFVLNPNFKGPVL